MNTSLIIIFVFVTLTLVMGAIVMAVKDLFFAGAGAAGGTVRLRRVPRAADETPASGPIASFDQWFLRTVRETGLPLSVTEASLLLVLAGTAVGGVLFLWNEQPLLGAIGAVVGMGVVAAYLLVQRARRIRQLQEELPTALDMLARGIRAGHSIDEAFDMVGRQSPEPLASEFRICAGQMAMGLSVPAVMRSLVTRLRLFDVRIFTTTLTVHRQTGGNIAKVLERLASVIRDRLNYRRQLRSVTGAGRLSAILIAAIGPCLFIYLTLCHPKYIHTMTTSPVGQTLLAIALGLEIIGLIWTARLMRSAY